MKQKKSVKILSVYLLSLSDRSIGAIYWMLNTSLKGQAEIYSKVPTLIPQHPSLDAYKYLLTETNFLTSIRNSLIVAVFVSLFSILIAYPAAYAIARIKFKGKRTFSKAILFTYLLPTSILYIPLYILVSQVGLTRYHFLG